MRKAHGGECRGLDKAIAGIKPNGRALVFVDHIHPTSQTKDQLKPHLVKMHHIGHRPAIGYADMAGDDRAAQTVWNKVAILHARAPNHPRRLIAQAAHHIGVLGGRNFHRRVQLINFHPRATGRDQQALAICHAVGVVGQQPQGSRAFGRVAVQPQPQPMARKHRNSGVIGGIDHIHPEPCHLGHKPNIARQIGGRQPQFRTNFRHDAPFLPSFGPQNRNLQAMPRFARNLAVAGVFKPPCDCSTSHDEKNSLILNHSLGRPHV